MPTLEQTQKSPYYQHFKSQQTERKPKREFKTNFMSWMDRLMRLNYASAGLAEELINPGEVFEPGKEVWKGLTGEDKTLYSNVLETVGWKPTSKIGKFARGATGFGLDILLDTLTYVGVGNLTKVGQTASKVGKLAPTIGKQAQLGQRALMSFMGKPIIKGAPVLQGLGQVGMAARKVPGVAKLGQAFVPGFRPAGIDPNTWNKLLQFKRKATAIQRVGNEKAFEFATGILDDINKLTKSGHFTDESMKFLVNSIEKRSLVAGLPNEVRPIWEKLVKYADDIAEKRQSIGKHLLDDQDYSYWLHTLSDAERERLSRTGLDISLRDWTTSSASDISRKYVKVGGKVVRLTKKSQKELLSRGLKIEQATINEINQKLGKEFFSTDIPYTSYMMGRRVSRQQAGTDFFNSIREIGSSTEIPGWVKSTAPELEGMWFNPHIAKEIDSLKKVFVGDEVTSGFAQAFDAIQNYWKKWTLGPFPAYHFRNMIGNTWNNYLAGVVNPGVYRKAAIIQRKVGAKLPLSKGEKELVEKAIAAGVLERGWYGTVLGSGGAPRYYKKAKSLGKKIADIGVIPAEKGLKAGRVIENNARLAHFIDKVNKGWNYEEAALSVKRYLFDYSELTPFEANTMRRLMPFYTWTRKNVPLQLQHIAQKPGKTVGAIEKIRKELAGGPEPERKYLPPWLAERYAFRVGATQKGISRYFPLESWLPIADVGKLARPVEAIAELTSPLIKTPVELMMNKSFYFDSPIEMFKGERKEFLKAKIPAKAQYALKNIRLFNELNRLLEKPRPTAFEANKIDKWVRALTGIKTYPQRINEMKRWAKYRIDKQIYELKKGYGRAKRNKDYTEAKRINKIIKKMESILDK